MHIASTLISAAVGGAFGTGSGGAVVASGAKFHKEKNPKPLLMGAAGAAVFAAQMMNFTIAGTGSSGHIGGGFLLAAVLGPVPAYLVMSVILTVQCLLFGDGGLLALGCNLFNMGIVPCLLIYPLLKKLLGTKLRIPAAALGGALSMFTGALCVVGEALLSGANGMDMTAFAVNMLGIHAAIGVGEGLITAGLLAAYDKANAYGEKTAVAGTLGLAAVTSGLLSAFASANPDGLEWSVMRVAGAAEHTSAVHVLLDNIQSATTLLPDYAFRAVESALSSGAAGLIGCAAVFALAVVTGAILTRTAKAAA